MWMIMTWAGSPVVLLLALVLGALVGSALPGLGGQYTLMSQIYLSLINMAALPLLVVATFFGLRQVAILPRPGKRLLRLLVLSLGVMALCAVVGLGAALLAQPGKHLSDNELAHLGQLVQSAGGNASDAVVSILAPESQAIADTPRPAARFGLVLDNYFQALAQGQLLSILVGALVFGAGIAALHGERHKALMDTFEAIYRTLESLISRANMLIPLLVFGMAALFASSVDKRTLLAMSSFLGTFGLAVVLFSTAALYIVWRRSGMPVSRMLLALKTPAIISLTSNSAMAAIPDTIHSMSTRLGFSRGVTEFIVPVVSIFVRGGSALYFAILIVFVANMYGRPIGPTEGLLICLGSMLGAFASAGRSGAATLGFIGVALHMLQLPLEAVVPLFLAIELLCEGPRNFLSFVLTCTLVALVSDGLPSERNEPAEVTQIESAKPYVFTFSRADLVIALVCVVLVMALIAIAGIGWSMQ